MHYKNVAFTFDKKEVTSEGEFSGYAAVFGNLDRGGDVIAKGAFDRSLKEADMPALLWQHNPNEPIGVWTDLKVDDHGLKATGKLIPEVAKGREAIALLRAGAVKGLSIGYSTKSYNIIKSEESPNDSYRELTDVDLWETSIVTFPMNPKATVTDVKQLQSVREVEHLLKEAGVPSKFAKLIAAHGYTEAMKRLNKDYRDDSDDEALTQGLESLIQTAKTLKETFNV